MVKFLGKGQDCQISTSQSISTESDVTITETLMTIIEQVPKLTSQERRQVIRLPHAPKSNSRKWSAAQTKVFYQLLRHFGLDFTLISYHPSFHNKRSQKELSNKYKKQLRNHPNSIDTVLNKIDQEGLYTHGSTPKIQ